MHSKKFFCENCKFDLKHDSDFCASCGVLFLEDAECRNHTNVQADAVCVICQQPFCENCGSAPEGKFLCDDHSEYEIFQNLVRVFGTSDSVTADYIKDCLEKDGLHAMVYSRKTSPISLGGLDYSLFRASGDYKGHLINELKVMVPLSEVLDAEKILAELKDV